MRPRGKRRTLAIGFVACGLLLDCTPHKDATDAGDAGVPDAGTPACTTKVPQNHMPMAPSCPTTRPPSILEDAGLPPMGGECLSDADCADGGANGRCVFSSGLDQSCTYDECFTNADCTAPDGGFYCACRDGRNFGGNECVVGNCSQDSDCGACGYCSPTMGGCGNHTGVDAYYCHTPQDECTNDADCETNVASLVCLHPATTDHWICGSPDCAG